MIYISLTKIKVPLIPGLIHWNLAWIMESHRIISCHWSNYCFETHHGQESSERGLLISQASGCFSMFFPVAPDLSQSFLCVLENWRPSAASAVKGIALVQRMGWGWIVWDGWKGCRFCCGCLLPRFAPFGFWITRTSSKAGMHRFVDGLQMAKLWAAVRKCWILPSTRGLKAMGFLNELHWSCFLVDLGARLVPLLLYQSSFGRCFWIVELPPLN